MASKIDTLKSFYTTVLYEHHRTFIKKTIQKNLWAQLSPPSEQKLLSSNFPTKTQRQKQSKLSNSIATLQFG